MNFAQLIWNRFKGQNEHRLQQMTAAASPCRPAGPLLRLNLPHLIGRRDAAYDQAVQLILSDLFSDQDERQRLTHYQSVLLLLDRADSDTKNILQILSSPDTLAREKKMQALLAVEIEIAEALAALVRLQDTIQHAEVLKNLSELSADGELTKEIEPLNKQEITLVNQLRMLMEKFQPRLNRYRGYTAKSFSPAYAARHSNARNTYAKLYAGKYQSVSNRDN